MREIIYLAIVSGSNNLSSHDSNRKVSRQSLVRPELQQGFELECSDLTIVAESSEGHGVAEIENIFWEFSVIIY